MFTLCHENSRHETHPVQLGLKFPSDYVWWQHNNRLIYFRGKNFSNCIKAGKNAKPLSSEKVTDLKVVNEEIEIIFAGHLNSLWIIVNIYFFV